MKDGWVKSTDYSTITIADAPGNAPSYGWEYTHLSNFQIQVGDFVTSGTFIGEVDFDGLPHIHLSKVFSQGDYWGWWRYMCMPNGHFSYIDEDPPVINTPFYFFENNSDTEIEPDGTGSVVLSGQVDIVVPMREQGLYARSSSWPGWPTDRLAVTKIEYEIRPTGSAPGSGQMFQSFDFNDIKIKSNALDAGYNAELTRLVYEHWAFVEGERTGSDWDKCFSYYIITNCSGEQSPQEINISDQDYCWDTTALGQDGRHLFGNGAYDIIVTGYDFRGHSSTQAMTVEVDNPQTCWETTECAGQVLGDATCDGSMGPADLSALKAAFGRSAPWMDPACCADFNHDGAINLADLFILKASHGTTGYSPSTGNQTCPP
jgi:hypothetical protein